MRRSADAGGACKRRGNRNEITGVRRDESNAFRCGAVRLVVLRPRNACFYAPPTSSVIQGLSSLRSDRRRARCRGASCFLLQFIKYGAICSDTRSGRKRNDAAGRSTAYYIFKNAKQHKKLTGKPETELGHAAPPGLLFFRRRPGTFRGRPANSYTEEHT